jgi:integrase/recombinase XerD
MKLNQSVSALDLATERYLERQRSLGRAYVAEEWIIDSLRRFLVKSGRTDLDIIAFEEWCKSHSPLTANTRRKRQQVVRKFCLYRQRTERKCFVPDISGLPRQCPSVLPVIFGPPEVARMLTVADRLAPTANSPLLPAVMRLAVVLLYTAGLRRGELLGLTLADVDPHQGVLQIRQSKFRKSRIVPLSPDACRELRRYLKKRLQPPLSSSPHSPLLCNTKGGLRAYTGAGLGYGIQALFRSAKVHGIDGRTPRVHDCRHSFALGSLLRWYREGADVQSNLPKLAMYMGHVSILSTAYYLRWLPELADAAGRRFETQFGHLVREGVA